MQPPRIAILAAGASSRLGQPKALVNLPGGQPVTRLVQAARQAQPHQRPLVIAGKHHASIAAALALALPGQPPEYDLINHPGWHLGRTSSIIAGARHLAGSSGLCILPVDHPRIDAALLIALAQEWQARGAPPAGWLAPATQTQDGPRPGHPIIIGADLLHKLLAEPAEWQSKPLRDLRHFAAPLWMLATDDERIHENLDRPGDLTAIAALDKPTP